MLHIENNHSSNTTCTRLKRFVVHVSTSPLSDSRTMDAGKNTTMRLLLIFSDIKLLK